ncbi:MAG: DUF4276 family protein [Phycisphaerae bacterium]|nr:DUF4276 family protein [Phycisphaerae bacterium]
MKVLIVSEGKHELSGALKTLVQRLAPSIKQCDQDRVSRNDIHVHCGKTKGYAKRAVRWIREAQKRGYDALVLVIDQDNHPERTRELDEAQESGLTIRIRRALGVAIRTFDAWMLADERALGAVLGYIVDRQPSPERIADPKSRCLALLKGSKKRMTPSDMYSAVAEDTDLGTLEARCPKGFAPFAKRVRMLRALNSSNTGR